MMLISVPKVMARSERPKFYFLQHRPRTNTGPDDKEPEPTQNPNLNTGPTRTTTDPEPTTPQPTPYLTRGATPPRRNPLLLMLLQLHFRMPVFQEIINSQYQKYLRENKHRDKQRPPDLM